MKRHAAISFPDGETSCSRSHKRLQPPPQGQSRNASPSSREYTPYDERPLNASTPLSSLEQLDLGRSLTTSLHLESNDELQDKIDLPKPDRAEVCFGMLCCKVLGAHTKALSGCTVDISTGQVLSPSAERMGELEKSVAKVLQVLSAHEGFSLQTYVHYTRSWAPEASSRMPNKRPSVHAIVYRPVQYSEVLGSALDKSRIYLQDPLDCQWNVQYCNPHRLADPRDRIRMTCEYSVVEDDDCDIYAQEDILAELESREQLKETDTPPALRTALFRYNALFIGSEDSTDSYSHQKQALTFMRRREHGWAMSPPGNIVDVWAECLEGTGCVLFPCSFVLAVDTSCRYTNNITNEHTLERPSQFRGGILGDTMGLGKSLTSIALIASDLNDARQRHRSRDENVHTTLLIVKPQRT